MPSINIKLSADDVLQLLGDSPEARLEASSSIVQQFASRHLKTLVNHEIMQGVTRDLQATLTQAVQEAVGTWKANRFTPNETVLRSIRSHVETQVRDVVERESDRVAERLLPMIESHVKLQVHAEIRKQVKAEVERRMCLAME